MDDVKAKGRAQIERYVGTTPMIQETIEKQLRNVQDSYNSLLHTAIQIKVKMMSYSLIMHFGNIDNNMHT